MTTGKAPIQPKAHATQPVRPVPAVFANAMVARFVRPQPTLNLPLESTHKGNMFLDRFNPKIGWYLPTFNLAADVDAAFSFAATQAGIDASGNPYNQGIVTLGLNKVVPPDLAAFKAANPTVTMREIPLTGLVANFATTAMDAQSGQIERSTSTAVIKMGADGKALLTINTLLGAHVLVAYNNLQNGGATLTLSAQYQVWRLAPTVSPLRIMPGHSVAPPAPQAVHAAPVHAAPVHAASAHAASPGLRIVAGKPVASPPTVPKPAPPNYLVANDSFAVLLNLGNKFAATGYATAYTVKDADGLRPILSIDDLQNFNKKQSQYSEFTALGDVSARFPSFSRLYIGALSRTIVAVPSAYGIVRSKDGTAAQCQALLDSSATGSGACKFQFAFLLGPVISPIDLFALQTALASNPQSAGCELALPNRLDSTKPALLSTPFQSSVTCTVGTPPSHTFSLAVEIVDGSVTGAAVANANLFIKQITSALEPFLSGSIGIALDDAYPHPISADVVLNLNATSGSDEIAYSIGSDGAIELVNNSPLDLQIARYAVVQGAAAPPQALDKQIPSKQSLVLSATAPSRTVSLLVDGSLALENPLTKEHISRYLSFVAQDVQDVNFQLAVVAQGLDFDALGIAKIDVAIALPTLPTVSVPTSSITALDLSTNAQISLPIQLAVSTLPGTITFTVEAKDSKLSSVCFTVTNDFIDQPVYVLQRSSILPFAVPA
jgi:hypothetical protein